MKSKVDLTYSIKIENGKIVGAYDPNMGHGTSLCVGGNLDIDDKNGHLAAEIPQSGDNIMFSIPSGDFEGNVISIQKDGANSVFHAWGTWEGRYGGLTGGKSCYGDFKFIIDHYTMIESSWGSMQYREYLLIRNLRDNSDIAESAMSRFRDFSKQRGELNV